MSGVDELLTWLVESIGYPFNATGETWIPEKFRRRLAECWLQHENAASFETVEDYLWACAIEGGWDNNIARVADQNTGETS